MRTSRKNDTSSFSSVAAADLTSRFLFVSTCRDRDQNCLPANANDNSPDWLALDWLVRSLVVRRGLPPESHTPPPLLLCSYLRVQATIESVVEPGVGGV